MPKDKALSRMSLHEMSRELSASGVSVETLLRDRLRGIRASEEREETPPSQRASPPKSSPPSKKKPKPLKPSNITIESLTEDVPLDQRRRMHLASMIATTNKRGHDVSLTRFPKKTKQYAGNVWAVEKLIDTRTKKVCESELRVREFLVRWQGFDSSFDEWVEEFDLSQDYRLYPLDIKVEAKIKSYMEIH